ncbi:MAG: T9SS type A sorting domain-containing protein, partial [Crocinitomicaceae bacterium]|nr:T9SS type A sorting domain-containing protein [Crocinitomicaceae bacterium]
MSKSIVLLTFFITPFFSKSQGPYHDWSYGIETGYTWGTTVCTDENNNIYTVAKFKDSLILVSQQNTDTVISNNAFSTIIQKYNPNGSLLWTKSIISTSQVICNSMDIDIFGDLIFCGTYFGSTDFDPSINEAIESANYSEIFVLKLTSSGEFVWVRTMKNISGFVDGRANSVVIDDNSDIVLTGEFSGTVDFDPGTSSELKTSMSSTDIFIQKLNSQGDLIWVKILSGDSADDGNAITTDGSNYWITGRFHGTVDFDPDSSVVEYSDNSSYGDVFVLKLNQNGQFEWVNCFGGGHTDYGDDIVVDSMGNVYTLGRFRWSVDFDPSTNSSIQSSVGYMNCFVQKVDSLGNFIWVKTIKAGNGASGSNYNISKSIELDNEYNILISGHYYGVIDYNPDSLFNGDTAIGLSDIFIEKLDTDGNFIWGASLGGSNTDDSEALAIDSDGNILLSGFFDGQADFDPSTDTFLLQNYTNRSMFIAKYTEGYLGNISHKINSFIKVFPNPFNNTQKISISNKQKSYVEISLHDISGKLVLNVYEGFLPVGNYEYIVDLAGLRSGIYLYYILSLI